MLLIWDVTSAPMLRITTPRASRRAPTPPVRITIPRGRRPLGRFGGKLARTARARRQGRSTRKPSTASATTSTPSKDEPLTPRTNESRRVCKDLTFSGPKSFSIVEAFASDEERKLLRQAFDDAITETVDQDIEPDMQTRVRIGGADYDRATGNLLTGGFRSRHGPAEESNTLPDPHWHRHLLVWNATYDPVEDRIKAGQLGDVVRDKGYYRAAFYSRLAGKLEAWAT